MTYMCKDLEKGAKIDGTKEARRTPKAGGQYSGLCGPQLAWVCLVVWEREAIIEVFLKHEQYFSAPFWQNRASWQSATDNQKASGFI